MKSHKQRKIFATQLNKRLIEKCLNANINFRSEKSEIVFQRMLQPVGRRVTRTTNQFEITVLKYISPYYTVLLVHIDKDVTTKSHNSVATKNALQ